MKHTKLADTLKTAAVLALTTAIGFLLEAMGLSQTNVITVYILGVLVVAAVTSSRWYSTAASLASVLLFNYIFTEPMFVLKAEDAGTQLTLLITFLAAVFTSTYTVQIKEKARLSQQDAYLSGVILDTSQILQKAGEPAGILFAAATQLNKLLKRDIACFQTDENGLLPPVSFTDHSPHPGSRGPSPDTLEEMSAARRCYMEGQETGAATSILSTAAFHYLPVQSAGTVYGVIGIRMGEVKPDDFENSLAIAILNQCATSMEKEFISRKREEETAMAKAEQLRSNLLRSMSHDLRTPLTSISGNAGVLLNDTGTLDESHKRRIYSDIYDDSMWLINLVENLLAVTRIEEGRLNLRITEDLMDDVITEALHHINRKSEEHHISVESKEEFLLAKMDAKLIVQVIINIVDNAIKYTPKNSHIVIRTEKQGKQAIVSISDDGNGIADEIKPRIFDMFYSGANQIADSRRSLGLGLSLCKSIINAHGGELTVSDNLPHGTVFTFTLPAGEVKVYE